MLARVLLGLGMIAVGALVLALLLADVLPENQKATSFCLEHVQAWSTLDAALVAAVGLGGVYFALRQGRAQQIIQPGPYVRIDVGPKGGTEDFTPPSPHFTNSEGVMDLAPEKSDEEKVSFWAWASNYQNHRLGFALAVSAIFLVEVRKPQTASGDSEPIADYLDLQVPYLEYGKIVEVELLRLPRDWEASLSLVSLSFYDLYDQRHDHRFGERSANALHGRLFCDYREGQSLCVPEARPRGPNIEFD